MDPKRKFELICGLITFVLGIAVTFAVLYVTQLTGQMLHESPPIFPAIVYGVALYLFPTFLVATGSYVHAIKKAAWGRIMVIVVTLFLTVLFFLSFVSLVWSRWVFLSLLEVSLTLFAVLTSVVSLSVRRESKHYPDT